ncbi:hypothetical protein ACVWY2_005791 [Bradyrhizobium sp. JR6.1]
MRRIWPTCRAHQRRIRQVPEPDREVDAVLDEVDPAIRQPQVDANIGIAFEVGGHDRADMEPPEAERRRDHQAAFGAGALALYRVLGLLDVGKDPPRPLQVARAGVGQRHLPRGPLQQPRTEPLLQRRDQPRDGGRRQAELAGGGGKPLEVRHRDERLHGIDPVHGTIA